MATLIALRSFNMFSDRYFDLYQYFSLELTYHSPTRLQLDEPRGAYRFLITGSFTVDPVTLSPQGTATAIYCNTPSGYLFRVLGLNEDTYDVLGDLSSGEPGVIFPRILSGDDRIVGSGSSDTLWGYDGNDTMDGGGFYDELDGGAGDDILRGGDGHDTLHGGAGNDTLDGGDGQDWISLSGENRSLRIDLTKTSAQDTGAGQDILRNIENVNVYGYASGDDTLIGSAADNMLGGEDGNDLLVGRAGNDRLWGAGGNDRLDASGGGRDSIYGGTGIDTLIVSDAVGVRIDLNNQLHQSTGAGEMVIFDVENVTGGIGHDSLTGDADGNALTGGTGHDRLDGRNGRDLLVGGAGDDWLAGGAGGDTLNGGHGRDVMIAGPGSDRDCFIFSNAAHSPAGTSCDIIKGFVRRQDVIDLNFMDASLEVAGRQDFIFTGRQVAPGAVWYVPDSVGITLCADVTGDAVADFQVRMVGVAYVTAADLVL